MSFDWKGVVSAVAPALGTALLGPGAGVAIKFLADKLDGVDPSAGDAEQQIADLITHGGSEIMVELKRLDLEFKKFSKQLELDYHKLNQQDRVDARSMGETSNEGLWTQITLTLIFIVGYLSVVAFLIYTAVYAGPEENGDTPEWLRTILTTLVALLTREVPRIMAFWFGSDSAPGEKPKVKKSL